VPTRMSYRDAVDTGRRRRGLGLDAAPLSVGVNAAFAVSGRVVQAACDWALLMVLARATSPEAVGRYTYGLAVTAPIFLFADLQLRTLQASDEEDRFTFSDYCVTRCVWEAGAFALAVCVAYLVSPDLAMLATIGGLAASRACDSVADIVHGLFQKREHMEVVAVSKILRAAGSLAAGTALVYLTGDVIWVGLGMACTSLLVFLSFEMPKVRKFMSRPARLRSNLVAISKRALPLGFVSLLMSLSSNIPRYALQELHGERELALYSVAAYVVTAGSMVMTGISQALVPRLSAAYSRGDVQRFMHDLLIAVAFACTCGLSAVLLSLAVGGQALALLYGDAYQPAAGALTWLSVGAIFLYCAGLVEAALTAAGCLKMQAVVSFALLTASVVLALTLVPDAGAEGAGQTTAAVSALALTLRGGLLIKHLRRAGWQTARGSGWRSARAAEEGGASDVPQAKAAS